MYAAPTLTAALEPFLVVAGVDYEIHRFGNALSDLAKHG